MMQLICVQIALVQYALSLKQTPPLREGFKDLDCLRLNLFLTISEPSSMFKIKRVSLILHQERNTCLSVDKLSRALGSLITPKRLLLFFHIL